MISHQNSHLTIEQSQQSTITRVSPFKRFLEIITHYDSMHVLFKLK